MSGMEPEAQEFLKRIVQTVSMGILFLLLHMTFGLYLNWGFFEGTPRLGNIIYYIIFSCFTFRVDLFLSSFVEREVVMFTYPHSI